LVNLATADIFKDERDAAPPISSYLLTREQLLDNEYPIPNWMMDSPQVGEDWLQTPEYTGNPDDECRILALDCEMVSTVSFSHARFMLISLHR
jgi:RNA exonuclease 1